MKEYGWNKENMNYEPDPEEQEILNAFERGELKSVPDAEQKIAEAEEAARNTLNRMRQIQLNLTERDYHLAYVKASEQGLPYPVLLSDIVHKYLTGQLVERGLSGI
ncbi:MAG TPA: antitoxin [Desulfobacteraceae bacterium]|nr:antitoxin [Desulfobacteraceae bacterium]